jgi:subfamily B ATP-binding cassette protein MsbA
MKEEDFKPANTAKYLLREAIPPRWKLLALSLICMVGVAGFTAALAYSTKLIVNDVFVAEDTSAAIRVAVIVIFVSVGKSAFQYANGVITVMFQRSVASSYQKLVFERVLEKDVWHFLGKHASTQMNQVRLYGSACADVVVNISNRFLTEGLTVVGLFVVMIIQDPWMTLFSSILFPLIFWIVSVLSKRIRKISGAEAEMEGAYFAVGTEAFSGIKTIKTYGLQDKTVKRFNDAVNTLERRVFSIAKITNATIPLMELLGGLVIAFFVIYAAWQTITYGKTPGEFTAFITAFIMAYQPAERLSHIWVEIQRSLVHAQRMLEMINAPVKQNDYGDVLLESLKPSVSFENVVFEYKKSVPALCDVSFEILPGERVAIVGRSGAGKTTLIDLVMRFYDPIKGLVRIGGVDLHDVAEASLRSQIALISQDVFLFEGSIRDNIRDGNPNATDDEIDRMARIAALGDVMEKFEQGLDTPVGPNGMSLSGGQKQRVGIARALVKDAKILIFDEATSALDGENERKIMQNLMSEMPDRTILFVTHRPSTLQYVDRVLMLDNGHLTAFETPETLERESAYYRDLFHLDKKV